MTRKITNDDYDTIAIMMKYLDRLVSIDSLGGDNWLDFDLDNNIYKQCETSETYFVIWVDECCYNDEKTLPINFSRDEFFKFYDKYLNGYGDYKYNGTMKEWDNIVLTPDCIQLNDISVKIVFRNIYRDPTFGSLRLEPISLANQRLNL